MIKLFNSQKIEGSETDAEQQLKNDFDDQTHSLPEKADEVEKCDEYLVLLWIPARVHQTLQKMMSLLMKKNMLISSTSLLQDQDGNIVHHILLIILFLLWILEFILDKKQEI